VLLDHEQHVAHALKLCDRVVIMEHGDISWTGPSGDALERVQQVLHVPTA
jgi:branched-chain amino acid transport system ATP-binding protein